MQNLPRDKERSKLRAAVCAPPGYKLISGDLSQIEARIVAKLAGQSFLVDSFRDGEDVYAQFASIVFGYPVTKADNPVERHIGKTGVLGLGYGCGWPRFFNMVVTSARQFGIPLQGFFDEGVAQHTVDTYRALFDCIPLAWKALDGLLAHIINSALTTQRARWPDDSKLLTFRSGCIDLPNRMTLRYTLNDPKLYGAKIFENIVQALARIVIMQAAVRLNKRGLRFALQSHDELVFVVPNDDVGEARYIIKEEMTREPKWMPGLPLAVEVGEGKNYGACK